MARLAVEPPIYIGPTWATTDSGEWLLPLHTLGWEAVGWATEYLLDPSDPDLSWRFTDEQLRFVLWWYAVDDEGRFVYRKGLLQRLKGWGKDPLAAVMALIEFVGPCRFSHWDVDEETGEVFPVATECPSAWVQVAAVSREQTRTTMSLFPALMSEELKRDYDVDAGVELIRAAGGTRRIEAVTSSYRALEGGRSTFVVLNEIHHWITGNQGTLMFETADGNVTKIANARWLAITNAYLPGEDSVAERVRNDYERIQQGLAADTGLLYDSIEAAPSTGLDEASLREIIPLIRGDAVWLDVDQIISSIHSESIPVARSRRMWLNQIVSSEDSLYDKREIEALYHPATLSDGDRIVLGFDGSKTRDATALIAIRLSDALVVPLGIWERPAGLDRSEWEVDRDAVDSAVHEAHRRFDVAAMFADVAQWESYLAEWERAYAGAYVAKATERSAVRWDMRGSVKRVTQAHEHLMSAILSGRLSITDPVTPLGKRFVAHILNAVRHENGYGVSFRKQTRSSNRKVDGYAALLAAHEAYQAAVDVAPVKRSRRSWAF